MKELEQFLSAYFHQDFELESESWEGNVALFRENEPAEIVELTSRQLGELMGQGLSDTALRRLLLDLGCYLDPKGAGMTAAAWLEQVKDLLDLRKK